MKFREILSYALAAIPCLFALLGLVVLLWRKVKADNNGSIETRPIRKTAKEVYAELYAEQKRRNFKPLPGKRYVNHSRNYYKKAHRLPLSLMLHTSNKLKRQYESLSMGVNQRKD